MNWIRTFYVPRKDREMVAKILNEITKPARRGTKTDIYQRGINDGISLVRQRAAKKGINLDSTSVPDYIIRELSLEDVRDMRPNLEKGT